MGAKTSMLLYADGDVQPVLQAAPALDRAATRAFVERVHPGRTLAEIAGGTLADNASPHDGIVSPPSCFTCEGLPEPGDFDLGKIALAGYRLG